jgi:hypothetical protein
MTGAGSGEVAVAVEDSFRTLPADPPWWQPGMDLEIGNASLENALERSRQPDDPRPAGSKEGNVEGALSVTYSLSDSQFLELVLADGGTALAPEAMRAPTATVYLAADILTGTEERFLEGAAVESWTVNYQQGEDVTVELTIIYANELAPDDPDAPATPQSITKPTQSDVVRWHDVDFSLAQTDVEDLQSLTVEVSGMARFRRGQSRIATDAVVGQYEPTLTFEAILAGGTNREYAYGSSGATTTEDAIAKQDAQLTLGSIATFDITDVQYNSNDWQSLVSSEDTTDPVNAHFRYLEDVS